MNTLECSSQRDEVAFGDQVLGNELIERKRRLGLADVLGEFDLDPSERQLRRGTSSVSVPPKAFDALLVFVENAGRLVRRDHLIESLRPGTFVTDPNLTNVIVAAPGDLSSLMAGLMGSLFAILESHGADADAIMRRPDVHQEPTQRARDEACEPVEPHEPASTGVSETVRRSPFRISDTSTGRLIRSSFRIR